MPDEARDVLMFVSLVLFVILMFVLGITLLSDVSWCRENYPSSEIAHCMHYENSVYGRYIQPEIRECYSTEFR
jgi:hypothetical protein